MYALRPTETSSGTLVERTTRPPVRGRKPLVAEEKPEAPKDVEVAEDLLTSKWKFSDAIKARFSEDILNSYVFDHFLTDDERRAYLRAYPANVKFGERLQVPGTDIYVLGHKKFDPPEEPIGTDRDKFMEWNTALVDRFVAGKDKLFGSVKADDRKFAISKAKIVEGSVVRVVEKAAKVHTPIVCGTGQLKRDVVVAIAPQVDKEGKGIPGKATVPEACLYTELLMREEHECSWFTPEELSVLFDDARNRDKIKSEFKK
jgi:hypothetical protein